MSIDNVLSSLESLEWELYLLKSQPVGNAEAVGGQKPIVAMHNEVLLANNI